METMEEVRRAHARVRRLKREVAELEVAGLYEQARVSLAVLQALEQKIAAAVDDIRTAELERQRRDRAARERHEAAEREREREAARRAEAQAWARSRLAWVGGEPQPAEDLLQEASAAGHAQADVEGVMVALRRRADGALCLGFRGQYRRRRYQEVDP